MYACPSRLPRRFAPTPPVPGGENHVRQGFPLLVQGANILDASSLSYLSNVGWFVVRCLMHLKNYQLAALVMSVANCIKQRTTNQLTPHK